MVSEDAHWTIEAPKDLTILDKVFRSVVFVIRQVHVAGSAPIGGFYDWSNNISKFCRKHVDEQQRQLGLYNHHILHDNGAITFNAANELELRDLFLLNEIQISNFMTYRTQFGDFLSIYELQAIPSWDLITIRNVSPFLRCEISSDDFNLDFRDALRNGSSTVFLKAKRVVEQRKGFKENDAGVTPFTGDPNHLYIRYRYEFGQLFKAGFTAEKDPLIY